jgi:hypothetical protein
LIFNASDYKEDFSQSAQSTPGSQRNKKFLSSSISFIEKSELEGGFILTSSAW